MATEKVVEREVPVEREVTVVRERGGGVGATGIIIALIVLAAVVIGGMFLMNMQDSEVAKDNAVAGAAESVSDAAGAVTPK